MGEDAQRLRLNVSERSEETHGLVWIRVGEDAKRLRLNEPARSDGSRR